MRSRTFSETIQVVRPMCVSLVCNAVVASAMAIKGWALASLLLAVVMVLTGVLLAIQVNRTVSYLRRRSRIVAEAAAEAERHYVDALRRIVRFVEARDSYTCGHSERVGRLAEQIARQLDLPPETCSLLKRAGQLHDIGMLAVPESVLAERARMGADGYRSVRKHSRIAYEVLKPLGSLAEVLPAILYHHERMNGTGYPAGVAADQIPVGARILAVADTYEAMTHDRPHRPAVAPVKAMAELRRCSPDGYDPACVEALAEVVHLPALEETFAAVGD